MYFLRDNVRAQLSCMQLLWLDIKLWWHLQRTKRRDPIFIWRTSIKLIEGEFGSALTSFFVFLRYDSTLVDCLRRLLYSSLCSSITYLL